MTPKQKAKACDEAYRKVAVRFGSNVADEIFLKESEDERIRKALINGFNKLDKSAVWYNGITNGQILAWLERQGKNSMGISEATKQKLEDSLNKALEKETPESCNEFLDEQSKQKTTEEYNIIGVGSKNAQGKLGEMIKNLKPINEVLEQKPTDKVEPKFHEGDWVVDNCGYVWKIEGILNQFYLLEGVEGGESRPTIEWIDKTFHLWTIQDAKDGDVLATENFIFVFKNIDDGNGVHYYCHYEISKHEDDNQFGVALPQSLMGRVGNSISHYFPATKEQCDTLIKAMADAGYELDAEKKELKKIEQKPAWSEEDEKMLKACTELVGSTICANYGEEDGVTIESCRNWLKSLRPQNWTKEDKERYISCLQRLSTGNPEQPETINSKWFKEHVYPQATWKPSDEQMIAIQEAMNIVGILTITGSKINSLYQDLKKLRGE